MDEIEAKAATKIDVQDYSNEVWGTAVNERGAIIYVPRGGQFKRNSACHELAHVERYWIHRAWRLRAADANDTFAVDIGNEINNDIEHLFMWRVEEEFGCDPVRHWTTRFSEIVTKSEWFAKRPLTRRLTTLSALISKEMIDADLYNRIHAGLHVDDADLIQASAEILEVIKEDKRKGARLMLLTLGLPVERYIFERYDVLWKTKSEKIIRP